MASTPKLDKPQELITVAANAAAAGLAANLTINDTIQTSDISAAIATKVEVAIGERIKATGIQLTKAQEVRAKLEEKFNAECVACVNKGSAALVAAADKMATVLGAASNATEALFVHCIYDDKAKERRKVTSLMFRVTWKESVRASKNGFFVKGVSQQQVLDVYSEANPSKDLNDLKAEIYDAEELIATLTGEISNLKIEISRIDRIERMIKSSMVLETMSKLGDGKLTALSDLASQVTTAITQRAVDNAASKKK